MERWRRGGFYDIKLDECKMHRHSDCRLAKDGDAHEMLGLSDFALLLSANTLYSVRIAKRTGLAVAIRT